MLTHWHLASRIRPLPTCSLAHSSRRATISGGTSFSRTSSWWLTRAATLSIRVNSPTAFWNLYINGTLVLGLQGLSYEVEYNQGLSVFCSTSTSTRFRASSTLRTFPSTLSSPPRSDWGTHRQARVTSAGRPELNVVPLQSGHSGLDSHKCEVRYPRAGAWFDDPSGYGAHGIGCVGSTSDAPRWQVSSR